MGEHLTSKRIPRRAWEATCSTCRRFPLLSFNFGVSADGEFQIDLDQSSIIVLSSRKNGEHEIKGFWNVTATCAKSWNT